MSKIIKKILEFDCGVSSNDRYIIALPFILLFVHLFVIDPGQRLFLPYWVSCYLIALALYYGNKRFGKKSFKKGLSYIFPKEVWLHPSTLNDCMLAVINTVLAPYLHVVTGLLQAGVSVAAGLWVADTLVLPQSDGFPSAPILLLYTFLILVTSDFSYYWAHRWAHKIDVWWELHKVHHSAEVMTPLTLARYHPIDNFIYTLFRQFGMFFPSGIFLYLYPSMPSAITIMSSNLFVIMLDIVGNNLRHTHIWLSFGPRIEHFLISPAMHQIHHSDNPKHFDKNMGAFFSVWDWMFGTLYIPEEQEDIVFGIGKNKETEQFDTVPKLLLLPCFKAFVLMKSKFTKTGNK